MAETCSNCRYYFVEPGANVCRRRPPYPFIVPASTFQPAAVMPIWPNPAPEAWCGDFRPSTSSGEIFQFPQRDPGDENPGGLK